MIQNVYYSIDFLHSIQYYNCGGGDLWRHSNCGGFYLSVEKRNMYSSKKGNILEVTQLVHAMHVFLISTHLQLQLYPCAHMHKVGPYIPMYMYVIIKFGLSI